MSTFALIPIMAPQACFDPTAHAACVFDLLCPHPLMVVALVFLCIFPVVVLPASPTVALQYMDHYAVLPWHLSQGILHTGLTTTQQGPQSTNIFTAAVMLRSGGNCINSPDCTKTR